MPFPCSNAHAIRVLPALATRCHVFAREVMRARHTPRQRCVGRYLLVLIAACVSFDEAGPGR